MENIKVGIIMPVRNCLHYTAAAIESIKTKYPYEVIVIDDHSTDGTKDWLRNHQGMDNFHYSIDPPDSTGLAYNWNMGCAIAAQLGCTHFLIANNDVLLHPDTIDALVERMEKGGIVLATGVNVQGLCATPTDIFSMERGEDTESEHPDFSMFMITQDTLEKIGLFDENFRGAYCEDCDYHARIVLLGERAISINRAPYYHFASGTVKENPDIASEINDKHNANRSYFQNKWGHDIVSEPHQMREVYFKYPYGNKDYSLTEWMK